MELFVYGYIVEGIITLLAILKTIHFIKNKNRNWKLYHWIYFSYSNIQISTSPQRVKLKQTQNKFSIIILIFITALIVLQLLIKQGE